MGGGAAGHRDPAQQVVPGGPGGVPDLVEAGLAGLLRVEVGPGALGAGEGDADPGGDRGAGAGVEGDQRLRARAGVRRVGVQHLFAPAVAGRLGRGSGGASRLRGDARALTGRGVPVRVQAAVVHDAGPGERVVEGGGEVDAVVVAPAAEAAAVGVAGDGVGADRQRAAGLVERPARVHGE